MHENVTIEFDARIIDRKNLRAVLEKKINFFNLLINLHYPFEK